MESSGTIHSSSHPTEAVRKAKAKPKAKESSRGRKKKVNEKYSSSYRIIAQMPVTSLIMLHPHSTRYVQSKHVVFCIFKIKRSSEELLV